MITLVLGGTRSGKSAYAERVAGTGPVTYVATARVDETDPAHVERIRRHRERRPATWTTVECPDPADLPRVLDQAESTVLLDSIGTWVTGHQDLAADPTVLVAALSDRDGDTVVVSEEVGLSVHPATDLGRRFVDAVGTANQAIGQIADRAVLVVAGRVLELGPDDSRPGTGDTC